MSAPVVVAAGAVIGERVANETSPSNVEGLSYMSQLGGWFQASNTVKKASYFTHLQQMLAPFTPPKFAVVGALAIDELTDTIIDELTRFIRTDCTASHAVFIIMRMGGASTNMENTVLSHRNKKYWIIYEASYPRYATPDSQERSKAWMAKVKAMLLANSGSEVAYPLFDGEATVSDTSTASPYEGAKKTLAQQIKQKYDPNNVFQLNKNIVPITTSLKAAE